MKQCPKCSRVYADDALNFCLDDGEWLSPMGDSADAPTAIISGDDLASEADTRVERGDAKTNLLTPTPKKGARTSKILSAAGAVIVSVVLLGAAAYKFGTFGNGSIATFQPGKITRLTGTGDVRNAAISPDGKFVAYLKDEPGQQSLWMIDVATTSTLQLVPPAPVEYTGLVFSPDGNYIYFSKRDEKSGSSNLFSIAKLGGTPKMLASNVDSSVTFSPDGKQITFIRLTTGNNKLIVANVDGSGERTIVTFTANEQTFGQPPAWSPDGKVIACSVYTTASHSYYTFVAGYSTTDGSMKPLSEHHWYGTFGKMAWAGDGSALYVAARDESQTFSDAQIWRISYPGGETAKITDALTSYKLAAISNDGKTLVTITDDLLSGLWVVPIDGGAARQISSTPGTKDGYCGVAWTKDHKIIYAAKQVALTDLWMVDSDGSNQRQLTNGPEVERYPSLDHDNTLVVFDEIRDKNLDVWAMDPNGSNVRQLSRGLYDTEPRVSPDGKWFAFIDENSKLERQNVDGTGLIKLDDNQVDKPAISPDGKTIACYFRASPTAPYKLAILPAEGGDPEKLFDISVAADTLTGTTDVRAWLVLRWTPDGKSILYVTDSGGASNIWAQPIDGRPPKQITDFKTDLIWTFDISPDGKDLVMSRGRNIDDVVMISNANTK